MLQGGMEMSFKRAHDKILVKKLQTYKFYDSLVAFLALGGLIISNIEVSILTPFLNKFLTS